MRGIIFWIFLSLGILLSGVNPISAEAQNTATSQVGVARLELQGFLKTIASDLPTKSNPPSYGVEAEGYTWLLRFSNSPQLEHAASGLVGKRVVILGTPTLRLSGGKITDIHCEVTSIREDNANARMVDRISKDDLLKLVKSSGEMLVRFKPGRSDRVVRICKEAGLEVVQVYGPGSYVKCRWPKGIDLSNAIAKVIADDAVEEIIPNVEVTPHMDRSLRP